MSEKELEGVKSNVEETTETHPFVPFIDNATTTLIVGTFPPHRFFSGDLKKDDVNWFYGSRDNSLWLLLENLFGDFGNDVETRKRRCEKLGIGFLDLFYRIRRYEKEWSVDSAIYPIEIRSLTYFLEKYKAVKSVLFTSSWVMRVATKEYLRDNRDWLNKSFLEKAGIFRLRDDRIVNFYHLPSPSSMNSDKDKAEKWREIFQDIDLIAK